MTSYSSLHVVIRKSDGDYLKDPRLATPENPRKWTSDIRKAWLFSDCKGAARAAADAALTGSGAYIMALERELSPIDGNLTP